jgi:AcrR family transcriptional regulator
MIKKHNGRIVPKVLPQYTDDAKRRIVLAAMEVMAERGYDKITIDDVAKKIGVTKGAVYWYFKSKSLLIQEVLVTIEDEIYKVATDPYLNQPDTRELVGKYDRLYLLEENRRDILYDIGLFDSATDSIPKVTDESVHNLISALEKGIEREKQRGTFFSPADPNTLALILALLCSGLQRGEIHVMLFLGHSNLRRTWFHLTKLFLNLETVRRTEIM